MVVYNYLCSQCLSPQRLWVRVPLMGRCTRYNIMWYNLSVTCSMSVLISGYSDLFHQEKGPPRYSWNIVESGIKHYNPKPNQTKPKQTKTKQLSKYIAKNNFETHISKLYQITTDGLMTYTHLIFWDSDASVSFYIGKNPWFSCTRCGVRGDYLHLASSIMVESWKP